MFLYSIYDRVAGQYSCPLMMDNDNIAKRQFPLICENEPRFKMFPEDLELYKVGAFDGNSGIITPCERPEFLCKYEVKVNE